MSSSSTFVSHSAEILDDVCGNLNEELRDIISEMGYSLEEGELDEIEKDLRLLEENADLSDPRLFSCLLGGLDASADLDQSLENLSSVFFSPPSRQKKKGSNGLPREFDELISHGYERLQEVYEDIKKYEMLLEAGEECNAAKREEKPEKNIPINREEEKENFSSSSSSSADGLGSFSDVFPAKEKKSEEEREKENKQSLEGEKRKRGGGGIKAAELDPREEKRLINKFLKENALRPTLCPEPGRLPFKHDRQLKLKQYRSQWAKMPPPGEQKRMALRWRIRELMLRRDIPHLRLVAADSVSDCCDEEDETKQVDERRERGEGRGGEEDKKATRGRSRNVRRTQPEWKP